MRSFSEEEGEGPSRRTNDSPPQHSSERFRPLNHGADSSAAVALIYCYVGCESVHALIVPTYTSHNLLKRYADRFRDGDLITTSHKLTHLPTAYCLLHFVVVSWQWQCAAYIVRLMVPISSISSTLSLTTPLTIIFQQHRGLPFPVLIQLPFGDYSPLFRWLDVHHATATDVPGK